jgi:hypothetical protein
MVSRSRTAASAIAVSVNDDADLASVRELIAGQLMGGSSIETTGPTFHFDSSRLPTPALRWGVRASAYEIHAALREFCSSCG